MNYQNLSSAAKSAIAALRRQADKSTCSELDATPEALWLCRTGIAENVKAQAKIIRTMLVAVRSLPAAEAAETLGWLEGACLDLAIASNSVRETLAPRPRSELSEELAAVHQALVETQALLNAEIARAVNDAEPEGIGRSPMT